MDDTNLTRSLAGLVPPDLGGSRERAVLAARARVAMPESQRTFRLRTAVALCLVVAIAGFASPPGRAAATWVAEQLGIGQPGGAPTLGKLREFFTEGTIADGMPAYVIARGPAPRGGHYEFITFRSKADGTRCFEFNLPEDRSSYGGGCEALPESGGVRIDFAAGNLDPDHGMLVIAGRVSADVESVAVELGGRSIPTELTAIDEGLLSRLGVDRPFKVYVAFPSDFMAGGTVEVSGSDSGGNAVGRAELELIDLTELGARTPRPGAYSRRP